jgi:hypothetical protein
MLEIATASLNSFAQNAEQAEVSPSEPIFVLTSSQLQEIIVEATKSLNLSVEALEDRIIKQDEKIATLEATQDTQGENEVNLLCLINDLRKDREPRPLQKDRGEILRALLAANGGKMLAKEARQKMHLSRSRFSELLIVVKDDIEVKPFHLKRNQKVLTLK